MYRSLLCGFLLMACLWAPALTHAQQYMTETGQAEFTSRVPLHTFTGTSEHLVGMIDLEENIVDFYIDLNTLETGIGRRDRDMRRTLNTEEHPFAEFYGELVSSFDPDETGPQPARVRGDFSINGVTREIEVEGTLHMTDDGLHVEASWELRLNDYNIEPPSILFVEVNEVQEIYIDALLSPD